MQAEKPYGLPDRAKDAPYREAAAEAYRKACRLAQLLSHAESYGARRVDRSERGYCSVLLAKRSHAEGDLDIIGEASGLVAAVANQLQLMRAAEGRDARDAERERKADAIGDFLESLADAEAVVGQLSTGERHALMRRWLGLDEKEEEDRGDGDSSRRGEGER